MKRESCSNGSERYASDRAAVAEADKELRRRYRSCFFCLSVFLLYIISNYVNIYVALKDRKEVTLIIIVNYVKYIFINY